MTATRLITAIIGFLMLLYRPYLLTYLAKTSWGK